MTAMNKSAPLWHRLGPGILLAATSIGASHLVHSPRAGALFGFELLWLIVAAHLFKYPAFECGPRYAAATGQHLLEGYAKVPGPRHWPLYLFAGTTVLQGIGVLAAVVNISGCVFASWIGDPGAPLLASFSVTQCASVALIGLVMLLLFSGGFSLLDHLNKMMIATLTLATVLAFVPVIPEPASFVHLVVPAIPAGSVVLIAAILGWMPTGIDVSIWHSFWTLEKNRQLAAYGTGATKPSSLTERLRVALFDMRVGYGLSAITGLMFVVLGAVHLSGRGAELSGVQFAQAISSAYSTILGRWMVHVFMLTAFFAMFSTSYVVIDGFSRSFAEALALLSPKRFGDSRRHAVYRSFVIFSGLLAAVTILTMGNPVTLVVVASIVSLAVAPILYALNLYCVNRHIAEPALQPSRIIVILGWVGTAFMVLALAVTVYVKLR